LAVAGQIHRQDRDRGVADGVDDGRLEGAVALAQQDADVVAALVGRRDVHLAVVVEIAHGHRHRVIPSSVFSPDGEAGGHHKAWLSAVFQLLYPGAAPRPTASPASRPTPSLNPL